MLLSCYAKTSNDYVENGEESNNDVVASDVDRMEVQPPVLLEKMRRKLKNDIKLSH